MDDLRIVGNENLTLEMYVMQLMHLKNIDQREEISQNLIQMRSLIVKKNYQQRIEIR